MADSSALPKEAPGGATAAPASTERLAIEVRSLVKRYGNLTAVNGISFSVKSGEIFGLLGPNGAGKTTTLEMIEGLRRPDSGEIIVEGIDVLRSPREARSVIGVQLQEAGLFERLTVRETIDTFARFHRNRVPTQSLLDRLDLNEKANSYVENLSGGQKQRLSIGLALVNDPKVVFLDEPTTGLDPQARRNLWDNVLQIRDEGRTVVITTHYMEEAEVLCDRVAIIDHGQIIALGTPSQLIAEHASAMKVYATVKDEAVRDQLHEQLRTLPGIDSVTVADESTLIIHTTSLEHSLRTLLDLSRSESIPLDQLQVKTSNLEDVFLQLTGRSLRE